MGGCVTVPARKDSSGGGQERLTTTGNKQGFGFPKRSRFQCARGITGGVTSKESTPEVTPAVSGTGRRLWWDLTMGIREFASVGEGLAPHDFFTLCDCREKSARGCGGKGVTLDMEGEFERRTLT